jgi:hypothetical protein
MPAGHANTGGIVKHWERPGRGCTCCPSFPIKTNGKRTRRVARRTAKQALRTGRFN